MSLDHALSVLATGQTHRTVRPLASNSACAQRSQCAGEGRALACQLDQPDRGRPCADQRDAVQQ